MLRLAEKEQGRVTVLEVAGRCDLTVDEAKAAAGPPGAAARSRELHVSEAGVLVYVFPASPGDGRARRRRRRR